jgi:2-polyprenyl-3-methyl-5-hydroxy-6-metoxy-1,4-benzoquinol methylase
MCRLSKHVEVALTYNPSVFDVDDLAQAMGIILTPEGQTTESRWNTETPYVADLIGQAINITPDSVILDYGCGVGRMAKALIARHGCRVVGVDISPSMRTLAALYVGSDRFSVCTPEMLDAIVEQGVRFDAALALWVLQHCLDAGVDIPRIRRALKPYAGFFVLNNLYRAVPGERGWENDGQDVKALLCDAFVLSQTGQLPPDVTTDVVSQLTFWASFLNHSSKTVS